MLAPVDQRIEFRIGINLGDIMNDEEDIYGDGDGVNVAAQLEALAPPGSASAGWCETRYETSSILLSTTGANSRSRISRGHSGYSM